MKRLSHSDYELRLLEIESDLYPIDQYVNMRSKLKHSCIKGHESLVLPRDVVISKIGCPVCAGKRSQIEYVKLLPEGLVLLEPYTGSQKALEHYCTKCSCTWNVRPADITSGGRTCPNCRRGSKTSLVPGRLYYVRISEEDFSCYKIGISTVTVRQRFRRDITAGKKVEVLLDKEMPLRHAYEKEQALLKEFAYNRLNLEGFLLSGGNSELFDKDVLKITLDSELRLEYNTFIKSGKGTLYV